MKLFNPLKATLVASSLPLQRRIARLIYPPGTQAQDFLEPPGEAALTAPDSLSWRIFANPVAMFVGGVAAVLLELAEPRVRSGVWEHTTFREQPMLRLQRTGYAAMMTVFGARSRAEAMICHVNAGHARISGRTPAGVNYRADDDELLAWVHATATYAFLQAYITCVRPVAPQERNAYYAENRHSAWLYGVQSPPATEHEIELLFERMRPELEPSDVLHEFLAIMQTIPIVPVPLRMGQRLLIRVAVQALPLEIRTRLKLNGPEWDVQRWQHRFVGLLGRAADHMTLDTLPAALSRQRLGTRQESS